MGIGYIFWVNLIIVWLEWSMVLSSGLCYRSVSFWGYFVFLIRRCGIALGNDCGVLFIVSHAWGLDTFLIFPNFQIS